MLGMSLPARAPTPASRSAARFGHALVPIAAAYVVAHYFSLLAYNGQDIWRLASDPLGDGSDLFGGAERGSTTAIVSATGIWYVQVAALVTGHVLGARARPRPRAGALRERRRRRARRSSCWC